MNFPDFCALLTTYDQILLAYLGFRKVTDRTNGGRTGTGPAWLHIQEDHLKQGYFKITGSWCIFSRCLKHRANGYIEIDVKLYYIFYVQPQKDFNAQKISECSSPNHKYHKNISPTQKPAQIIFTASPSGRDATYLPQLLQRTQNWSSQLHAPFPEEPQPRAEGQHWAQGVLSCSKEKQQLSSFPTLHLLSLIYHWDTDILEWKSNSTQFT